MLKTLLLTALSLGPSALAQYPNPGRVTGSTFAHDPTVVLRPNGGYLLAYTAPDVALKTSSDRTAWQDAGTVFPGGAPWTTPYTNGDRNLWAPDLSYHNGQYYLYYSASSFGSQKSAIFLATSASGASGSWTNRGVVVESTAGSDFNAIDPNLVVDDAGAWRLAFGSFWGGIYMIDIDSSSGLRRGSRIVHLASRPSAGGAIEAPVVVKHGSYWYLWASFDKCCQGAASTYRVMVGRSASIEGPYVDKNGVRMLEGGGTEVLASHGGVHGPGHQAVLEDGDGTVLFYHWYADDGRASLGINRLSWQNGWPVAV